MDDRQKLDGISLGCLSCKDYELQKPQHGNGDAPYYKCKKDRDPDSCRICIKNAAESGHVV